MSKPSSKPCSPSKSPTNPSKTTTTRNPTSSSSPNGPCSTDVHPPLSLEFYELKKIYNAWNFSRGIYQTFYQIDVIRKYLQYYYELTEFDIFESSNKRLGADKIPRGNLVNSPSEDILFKSFDIFSHTLWKIKMTNKFIQRLTEYQENGIKNILAIILYLANGNLPGPSFK